jgi:predicted DNA repair protein MutK
MSGLLALLDDVAAIAKVAAASLDDVPARQPRPAPRPPAR